MRASAHAEIIVHYVLMGVASSSLTIREAGEAF